MNNNLSERMLAHLQMLNHKTEPYGMHFALTPSEDVYDEPRLQLSLSRKGGEHENLNEYESEDEAVSSLKDYFYFAATFLYGIPKKEG